MKLPSSVTANRARFGLLLFLLLVATALFSVGQDEWKRTLNQPSADGAYYYAYLPTLFLDRDLDFDNQYQVTKNWYRLGKTPTGRASNVFGVGPAVFQSPFFLVGHGIAIVTGQRRDGFSSTETWLCLWSSILFTLGAVVFAARLAERRVRRRWAGTAGAVLMAVAGPVCYYALRQPGYAHPYATFATALLVERWDASYDTQGPRGIKTWLVLGGALGLAMLARPQLATWGILLIAAALDDVRKRRAGTLSRAAAGWLLGALLLFVIFLPQLLVWKALYGAWYVVPQGPGFMRWDDVAWSETLFSSRNGLFPWAPLYLPALAGLCFINQRLRLMSLLVLGLLLQALVNGAAWDWWGGGSFGGRRFDSTYVVFALGCSAMISSGANWVLREGAFVGARRRARAALVLLLACAGSCLVIAQLILTARTSVVSARITGGVAPESVWRDKAGPFGRVAGTVSSLETLPVRAFFGARHSVGWDAYDRLVGVHQLGETFPGLNAYADKRDDSLSKDIVHSPSAEGLAPDAAGFARLTATDSRLLLGLNRRAPVSISVAFETLPQGVSVLWDGAPAMPGGQNTLTFTDEAPRRGVHVVEIRGPVGTQILSIKLHAD